MQVEPLILLLIFNESYEQLRTGKSSIKLYVYKGCHTLKCLRIIKISLIFLRTQADSGLFDLFC